MKTIEEIIKVLNSEYYGVQSKLKVKYDEDLPNGEVGLNRKIEVISENGEKFYIMWWKNISYLHYVNAIIPFTDIKISSSFPNNSKLNLVLNYNNKESSFILKIREY